MNELLINILKNESHMIKQAVFDDHLLKVAGGGHTVETVDLPYTHPGRDSVAMYVYGRLIGAFTEKKGLDILHAIEKLQVKNEQHEHFGAFRWYAEESRVIDTNAAFFILSPLAILRMFEPDCISKEEKVIIDEMMTRARQWFLGECANPKLWYTNKIISDGAVLICVGKITNDQKVNDKARVFLNKWLDYTENRGFGWGENLSNGYNSVTLQAITMIKKALTDENEDQLLKNRFDQIENELLDLFRFFDGYEFTPTIRSYNILGYPSIPSYISNLAKVADFGLVDGKRLVKNDGTSYLNMNAAISFMLYGDRLYINQNDYSKKGYENRQAVPRVRQTHIMDDKKAYSWIGKSCGLGSINQFPVIEGSYQHKGWGLGWQCFPVNMIVHEKQVSFLRFKVDDGKRVRNHPHVNKKIAYLDSALFAECYYPSVKTNCYQKNQTAIVFRSINHLRNKVQSISDSLDIQRFDGKIVEHQVNHRKWIALKYDKAVICVTSLNGIYSNSQKNTDEINSIEVSVNKSDVSVEQFMYQGKLQTLFDDRIYAGWVIHMIDQKMSENEIATYLEAITIEDCYVHDAKIPRQNEWLQEEVKVLYKQNLLVNCLHDPYQ